MGCLRFCFILIPSFLTLCALVLSAIACSGASGKNKLLTSVYELKLNFADADVSQLLNVSLGDSVSLSDVGISDVYIFGMWGHCQGNLNSSADSGSTTLDKDLNLNSGVTWTHCSKPKAMYVFDPVSFFSDQLNVSSSLSSTVEDLADDIGISLPSKIDDYTKTAKILSKLIFICTIIGVVLAFVTLVLGFLTGCCCGGGMGCFVTFISLLSTVSLLLACGASTGMYQYIVHQFSNASAYGVDATMSKNYLGAFWGGLGASLLSTVFWFLSSCCSCCGSAPSGGCCGRRGPLPDDEKPMLVYSH
ncbi:unnamed protein product [Kuraishia capsulata CBS 1993]|uniref:Uncharacterized protein n=1 Tax=Kuraishia capsulata CBS 1993 TaxID=1382522 RepID=W6MQF7_9ASCO|nr:uncharacterized protein KUCA_T00000085001 [Kuraishia capsulata CBS 1993]CDK24125.1 unnamed protein product [Kuraishia capsulata CBS 1993]